jgi:hypothetical protein
MTGSRVGAMSMTGQILNIMLEPCGNGRSGNGGRLLSVQHQGTVGADGRGAARAVVRRGRS